MEKTDDLTQRAAPLDVRPDEFRALGHHLIDRLADFLDSLPQRPVTTGEPPQAIREALGAARSLPERGADPAQLLDWAADLLFDHSLFNSHPRFWGYITAPAAPIGILGDLLAAAVNPNVGAWFLSPMASEIEAQTIRWIAEMLGFPTDCGGLLVSGGNMANLVCFLAARQAKAGWDVRAAGVTGGEARRLRVYGSKETHTWIQKAADMFGLGADGIRWIPTDDQLRMDTTALRKQIRADIEAGERPFLVVGTGGSVSTGAIDPLPELAAICREYDLWFHVDGAYGGFAAILLSDSRRTDAPSDLKALSLADSVAVDPHKWLYMPLEAGCALVRDPVKLREAFAYHPPYYLFGVEAINYLDFGPQNSRGFRALKVWLALQQVGREGYARMISDDIWLAQELYHRVSDHPALQAFTQSLSITTFRYIPPDLRPLRLRSGQASTSLRPRTEPFDTLRAGSVEAAGPSLDGERVENYLNELNRELLTRLQNGGEAYLSNAVIGGKFLLRACIVNFRTSLADIEALPGIVTRLGQETDAALRPEKLDGKA